MNREIRGLRFSFDADAELVPESSPKAILPARVTELSLQGCFLETSASLEEKHRVLLKISEAGESFEAEAVVLYARPSGLGLVFREVKPRYRETLQTWILKALERQLEAQQIPS
jgi:PilZ domain